MITPLRTARQEWQAHWGLVLAGFLGISLLTIPPVTLGLFIEPLQGDFGWSRARISFGMMIFAAITTPLAPFAGALADRYGSRRIAIPGVAANGIAWAAFALLTGFYWHYALAWVLYAFSQLMIRTTIWNRAASGAFSASRGLALAVMMGGIPFSQTFAPIVAAWLIGDYGWRAAFAGMGLGWGGIALVVGLLLFREPRAALPRPDGSAAPAATPAAGGLSFREAVRDPRVVRIGVATVLQGTMATGLSIHIVPLLTQSGVTRAEAAGIIAMMGLAALTGQLVTGWLADRTASTALPVFCFAVPLATYGLLLGGGGSHLALTLAVIAAGYASSSTVTMTTYLTSRYAGVRKFGTIFGLMSSGMGLGAGLGPFIAGTVFDRTGSYHGFLVTGLVLAVVAALLVFRLGPYPVYAAADDGRPDGRG